MHQPTGAEVEVDKAKAVAEATGGLSSVLAVGWGLAAYFLGGESWIAGITIGAGLYWLVRRPYVKRYNDALARVSRQSGHD
ncbi:hypothetical protein [Comamonas antarctica]|uniref:hypothetical protein n=1 Tax=Comamonas antarctica TaxID=2743470 RepID=UPI0028E94A53|nr:hypothetical protein [Comamonas antarctica]